MILKGELGSLEINVHGRSDSQAINTEDIHWLNAEIKVELIGFNAHYKTDLHTLDLQRFYNELLILEKQAAQKAIYSDIEEDLDLELLLGIRGDVLCNGIARYQGNSLHFKFESDLFTLSKFTKSLNFILHEYTK